MPFLTLGADMARPSRTGGKTSEAKARNASPAKGRKTTKTKRRIAPAATRVKRRSVSGPSKDLKEAREQQAATAEILKVIASSPDDVQPVFEAIVANANRLIGGFSTAVYRFVDGIVHLAAFTPINPAADEDVESRVPAPDRRHAGILNWRSMARSCRSPTPKPAAIWPLKEIARARGFRSVLYVPLMSKGTAIGFIIVTRREPRPVLSASRPAAADLRRPGRDRHREHAAVRRGAAHGTAESLQQQTATADVLKIISRSSVDLETVLETLVETVARLCRADQVYMFHLRHDLWHLVAAWGLSAEAREFFLTHPFTPGRGSTSGRAALERRAVHIPDVLQDPEYTLSEGQKIAGYRTMLGIPLLREDTLIGVFSIARTRVEAFHGQGDRAGHHLRRPGGDRDGECAAV